MKKTALVGWCLIAAIALGIGISVLIPPEAYACACELGYPPAATVLGPCKDGTGTLYGSGCVGRYVCPPYNPCHCYYTVCVTEIPCEWPCE